MSAHLHDLTDSAGYFVLAECSSRHDYSKWEPYLPAHQIHNGKRYFRQALRCVFEGEVIGHADIVARFNTGNEALEAARRVCREWNR